MPKNMTWLPGVVAAVVVSLIGWGVHAWQCGSGGDLEARVSALEAKSGSGGHRDRGPTTGPAPGQAAPPQQTDRLPEKVR
jgi:hypothetical protein